MVVFVCPLVMINALVPYTSFVVFVVVDVVAIIDVHLVFLCWIFFFFFSRWSGSNNNKLCYRSFYVSSTTKSTLCVRYFIFNEISSARKYNFSYKLIFPFCVAILGMMCTSQCWHKNINTTKCRHFFVVSPHTHSHTARCEWRDTN